MYKIIVALFCLGQMSFAYCNQPGMHVMPAPAIQTGPTMEPIPPTTPATATLELLPSGLPMAEGYYSKGKLEFHSTMRKVWEDHVMWTRLYLVSAQASLPDKEQVLLRLLKNQKDIGDAIMSFYGVDAGKKLTTLLTEHIVIAGNIIEDLLTSKKPDADLAAWSKNGDDIATFLSAANPTYWPLGEMKAMMRDHLETTKAEVIPHVQKNWAASINGYDVAHEMILQMADHLTMGMLKQFPDKFKN